MSGRLFWLVWVNVSLLCGVVSGQTRLLRFPDLHGDQVVFSYAGDLWRVSASGGTATRITTHPGLELFAKFSPDGKQIAFTGQYDGDEQVYVVEASGGIPRQLTYYPARGPLPDRWGFDNQVYGWSVDGARVLFRSLRYGWTLTDTRLFTVELQGGLPVPLPMPVSGGGDYSPTGKQVVYSPLTRDFRTWKRYAGGWAQDLFIFDLQSHESKQITSDQRSDRDPMWIGDRVYYASDRDGTLNLYSYDTQSGETRQETFSKQFDVRWPSKANDGRIVYELGGELQIFDTATRESTSISIRVPTDGLAMRPRRQSVASNIEDYDVGPDGKRLVVTARGDVFTVPLAKGPTRNLTTSSTAHDKAASWSPDGTKIAFISDQSGEEEIYLVDPLGAEPPQPLTAGGTAMRYAPTWAPDSRHLAFSDKDGRLFVIDTETKKLTEVVNARNGQLQDFEWSPHSEHIAFAMTDDNGYRSLYIWSREDGQIRRITDAMFDEFSPTWDREGKYLYYLSYRQFAPQIGSVEWNYVVDRSIGVFALALRKDVGHPVPPESDEVQSVEVKSEAEDAPSSSQDSKAAEGDSTANEQGAEQAKEDKPSGLKIDFDGLQQRVARLPIEDDNYVSLVAVDGHLVLAKSGPFYYGRSADVPPSLLIYSPKTRKTESLIRGVAGFAVTPDGKKLVVRQGASFKLLEARPGSESSAKTISTAGLVADIDPRQEWRQIFHEVWRRYRDFFYVDNMHGYDWQALRAQYEPLLEHVAHRSDLNYVIGEMIGELNVGHAYNTGGDFEIPERPRYGLPGATFELDQATGLYRIARIYDGNNQEPVYRSPLTEIGIKAEVGHYVLAIDGEPLKAGQNPYALLRNKATHPVSWTLNHKPELDGSWQVSYQPITSESDLVYLSWVNHNRELVDQRTSGRVGYLHVPNMGAEGIREFTKWFYGQIRKDGLVIDVRANGGGNVSQMLINRLARTLLATRFARTTDATNTYPGTVFHGHLVCVLDENSASDGDIFPAMFKQAGLGPLVGKRSWGGVTGITNRGTLIDGGTVNVPEFGFASADGQWIIEGYGVDPDIEVDYPAKARIAGQDPQLERAIKEVLEAIAKQPRVLPPRPAPPIKTKASSQ